jgi:hypothetical protein
MTDLAATSSGSTESRATLFAAAILFACGCAFVGIDAGLLLYTMIFESLRAFDLDQALDSPQWLDGFRNGAWAVGLLAGGLQFWRWHRNDLALAKPARFAAAKRLIVCAVGTAGAAHLGYAASDNISIGIMLLATFVSLLAGAAVMTWHYAQGRIGIRVGHFVLTLVAAVALIFVWLMVSQRLSQRYHSLGEQHSMWFEIQFPEGAKEPDPESIAVELRTPEDVTRGFASEWLTQDDRRTLRANVDLKVRTRDRVLVVTLPGEPALIARMPFPANPAPTNGYGLWRPIEAPEARDGAQRRVSADYRIRYMRTN